jgi:hypothetical protein
MIMNTIAIAIAIAIAEKLKRQSKDDLCGSQPCAAVF